MSVRSVIKKYYEYANEGNWDAWCDLFAESMVMDEQLAGHIEGLPKLRSMMAGMKDMYSKFQNVPDQIMTSGRQAAVVSHISAASPSGAPVEAAVMNYFRVEDEKIVYMSNFHDTRPFDPVTHPEAGATAGPQPHREAHHNPEFPRVHRFMGRFMELPKDHVNAYIVELENSVVVVDTTLALSSARELRAKAESFGKPIEAVLLTHGHPDHYTGLVAFEDVPRLASQGCVEFAKQEDLVKAPTATAFLSDDYPKTRVFPNEIVSDGDTRVFDGFTFTFRDLGPAESPSDGMWIVGNNGVREVFVGDTIAMNCHCFFRDGYTRQWNKVLENLRREFDDDTRFYIGHGDSPVGKEAIAWQLGYNTTFLNAVDNLQNKTMPVSRESQDEVRDAVRKYLPGDATLFLLEYELDQSIALHFPNRGFGMGMGRQFYAEHMQMLGQGKFEEVALLHYAPDCSIVTFDGIHHGREELKEYIIDTFRRHKTITGVKVEYFNESEDVIIFRATVTSEGRGTIDAQDAFYMENGKIKRHIALTLVPDADYDQLGTRWKE